MVSFLLKQGSNPNIKDVTGRTVLDIAIILKKEETIQVLKDFQNSKKSNEWNDNIEKRLDLMQKEKEDWINKFMKFEIEFTTLKTQISNLENENKLKDQELLLLKSKIIELEDYIKTKEMKFNDSDIKGTNSNHLERISFQDVEKMIDNLEFQDIFEVKHTLDYLEESILVWVDEKLEIPEFDQDLVIIIYPNKWKTKDQAQLIEVMYQNISDSKYDDFEINKKIEKDHYPTSRKMGKSTSSEEITKFLLKDVLDQWSKDNSFHNEIVEFIKLIPIDKILLIKEMKKFQMENVTKME